MTYRFVAVFANPDCWCGVMVEALHYGICPYRITLKSIEPSRRLEPIIRYRNHREMLAASVHRRGGKACFH